MLTRRDQDGSDADWQGASFADLRVPVRNARLLKAEDRRTVVANGFELRDRSVSTASIDFLDHSDVVRNYYPQCAEIVREATGAQAFAFDHNVRSASGEKNQQRIAGEQEVQGPAHVVHGDYTADQCAATVARSDPAAGRQRYRALRPEEREIADPTGAGGRSVGA